MAARSVVELKQQGEQRGAEWLSDHRAFCDELQKMLQDSALAGSAEAVGYCHGGSRDGDVHDGDSRRGGSRDGALAGSADAVG